MERRTFLKSSLLASTSLLVPNFLQATANNLRLSTGKNLVIIQLSGGNDGLNTVVPYTNDIYYQLRPTLNIQKYGILKLTDELGLNSNLTNLKKMYDNGLLSIINGVGYPNPNRSHFRSIDIWQSASSASTYENTGWLGRYIDNYCDGVAPAIEVDDTLSLALKGNIRNGLAVSNPAKFYRTSKGPFFEKLIRGIAPSNLGSSNLDYLYKTAIDTQQASSYINEKNKLQTNKTTFPNSAIGKKLKQTAKFINARLSTQVYYVSQGGFDTHANQLNTQSRLLSQFDEAIGSFVQELKQGDSFENALVMVFSEFGRRVKENGSGGTDHGTANPVFILNGNLKKPGILSEHPSLENLDKNGDLIFNTDFRSIYATVLDQWLGASSKQVLGARFKNLNFI